MASSDADDMQSAFQAFMLSGGGSGKKKKKGQKNDSPQISKSSPSGHHQRSNQREKTRKQYWLILNAFRKTLQEDWLEADDHAGQVVASIVNLRDRIHMTSQQLWHWKHHPPLYSSSSSGGFGYRKRRNQNAVLGHLTQQDLELALSHGLIQHEKMLVGVRKLVSSLNQAQDALGRRLDELLIFHLEMAYLDDDDLTLFASHVVNWCRQVYTEMANELYRKQCLVRTLVNSVEDGLLYLGDEDNVDDDDESNNPRKVAEKCLDDWPRGGPTEESRDYLIDLLSSTPWEESKTVTE